MLLVTTARIVEMVALAASAGSVLFIFEGWLGWVTAAVMFAGVAFLWREAMSPRAPWPLPTSWHYLCKIELYVFAALVLSAVNGWAGLTFAVTAVATELLLVHLIGLAGERPVGSCRVSPDAGRGA